MSGRRGRGTRRCGQEKLLYIWVAVVVSGVYASVKSHPLDSSTSILLYCM